MLDPKRLFVNIHGHRQASNIQEWVIRNLMASDYPPDDIDYGYYSVGFHPYNVGKVDEQNTLDKVSIATKNPKVLAIGEIGLDKSIEAPMEKQSRVFEAQLDIAEQAQLPVILHVVRAFNEVIEIKKTRKPSVPMIIHGYNGSHQMADALVRAGFLISFGEAICGEHSKIIEALLSVPLENMFLETDEGDLDIREVYQMAAEAKGLSTEQLRMQILENAKIHLPGFAKLL